MKRIILIAVLIFLLAAVMAVVGCSRKSHYQVFMEAVERTEALEKGKMSMDMVMEIGFNKEGLPEDALEFLKFFENLKLSLKDEFDKGKNESVKKIFLQSGELGIDAKIYTRGDVSYVITPLIPKILVIKGEELIHIGSGDINDLNIPSLSEESLEQLKNVWQSLYSQENVTALEDIVLDTPGGKVKAKKYRVKLTDQQLKPALKKSMEIISQDKGFMDSLEIMMESMDEEIIIRDILRQSIKLLDQATINSFDQLAYIDRDNYVIEETVNLDITLHFTEPGTPRQYKFNLIIERWDLNREPKIDFPEVTPENSITPRQLKEGFPDPVESMKGENR